MDMNRNILDLDHDDYGWDDRDEEACIRQTEEDDVVHELRNQQTIPLRGEGGCGTSSSHDSSASPSTGSKRTKLSTSKAWEYMEVQLEVDANGNKKKMAKCKFCGKILNAMPSNGTRHLLAHGKSCAQKYMGERNPMQSQLQFQKDGSVSTWTYNPMVARESLARLISATDLPINFGDNPFYEDHIKRSFCPQFKKVSRTTTRSDIISYYNKVRIALKSEISSSNFCIALTSDIWSGRANEDYISVVAHYIDSKWIMQKRIIGFKLVDSRHTANTICERVLSVIEEFGIRNRIISITLDNASANTKAIEDLQGLVSSYTQGFLLHQRCACHIINLIVKSGMKMIDSYIGKIRDALAWINQSNQRIREFKQYCVAEGLKPRKFGLDMPIRWNSTYLMLKNTIDYKNAITVFYNLKMGSIVLQELDWLIVEKFVQFLEVFYDATVILSGVYYPTSPLVLHNLLDISEMFFSTKNDPLFEPIVEKMIAKFKKYWSEIPLLYCFAIILDPRVKLKGLYNCLAHIGRCLDLNFNAQFNVINNKLFEVYSMYENKFGNLRFQQPQQAKQKTSKRRFSWDIISNSPVGNDSSSSSSSFSSSTSTPASQHFELTSYIEADSSIFDVDQEEFNILQWWQNRQTRYPVLSQLARDILTIPVSTVSSESAFSTAGRIIEERRTSLTSDMVEVLTCLKDWEHAEQRIQHTTHNEDLANQFQNLFVTDENAPSMESGPSGS